jgi:sterol desaturase/sphingolipid hydroxylase (fatty acid hydroxylase superfamily)
MHLLKSARLHVGEEFLQFLVVPVPFLILGVGPEVMAWVALWNVYDGNLVHSNLAQRFPSFLHWFWPTAQNHYLHHAVERHLQDSNYASMPIIDVLFGTYRHPDRHPVTATGLAGNPVPRGFLGQLLYPFGALLRPAAARAEWEAAARAAATSPGR